MSVDLDLEYHNLCRNACDAAGGILRGSSINAGCTMGYSHTNVTTVIPHAAIKWFAELRQLRSEVALLREIAEAAKAMRNHMTVYEVPYTWCIDDNNIAALDKALEAAREG